MELGSEFNLSLSSLIKKRHNIFSYIKQSDTNYFFDCGRNAIRHISKFLDDDDEILLPEFICESVINCFNKTKVQFYRLKENFILDINDVDSKITPKTKVFFLMHYFGSLQPDDVLIKLSLLAKRNNLVVIEDTTHSIFSKRSTIGDYVISSIRKWCPVPGCGVLSIIENKLEVSKPKYPESSDNSRAEGMVLKDMFLRGIFDCNSTYRKIFEDSENILNKKRQLFLMSNFSRFVLECYDTDEIRTKRKRNFDYLESKLSTVGLSPIVRMKEQECPLAFVIRLNHRDEFRRYLIDNRIYCAVHWPFDGYRERERKFAQYNAQTLISLPIDQRYDKDHLDYLVDMVSKYRGELSF